MSDQSTRRSSLDYLSMPNRAWLGWYVETESTHVPGRVMEISQSGVSILVEEAPPLLVRATAWVQIVHPTPTDWTETVVLGITEVHERKLFRRGPVVGYLVHLQFAGPFPYDFFKAATHATEISSGTKDAGLSEAEKAIWR